MMTDAGVILGAGCLIAPFYPDKSGLPRLDLEGDHDRVIALLAVASRGHVPPGVMKHLSSAAERWRLGDKALANIRLVFAGLPHLADDEDAYRLFLAGKLLSSDMTPFALMKALNFSSQQTALLKSPGQARVAAGNGRQSGEYGSGSGVATTPVQLEVPFEAVPQLLEPFVARPVAPQAPLDLAPVPPNLGPRAPSPTPVPPVAPLPTRDKPSEPDKTPPTQPPAADTKKDDDDPRRCPAPVADTPHKESPAAEAYTIDGHNEVNKVDPLKLGEAILYHGIYFDDCARTDDPLGRWKAGDMIEFKGPTYDRLLNEKFAWFSSAWDLMDQAERQHKAVDGTGRGDTYLVAEERAAGQMGSMFKEFTNIKVFHFPPVTLVPSRPKKFLVDLKEDLAWI